MISGQFRSPVLGLVSQATNAHLCSCAKPTGPGCWAWHIHGFQLDLVMLARSEVLWRERRCWSEGDLRFLFLMTRNETCLETFSFFLVVDNTTLFCWQKIPYSLLKLSLFPLDKLFLTYCSICSCHLKLILSVQIEIVAAESRLHPWAVSPSLCPPRWRHPRDPRLRGQNLGRWETTDPPTFRPPKPTKIGSFASNI